VLVVNLYHTSSSEVPTQPLTNELVALATLPVVGLLHEVPTVKLVAPEQLSLAGAEPVPQDEQRQTKVVDSVPVAQLYFDTKTLTVPVKVAVHCIFGLLVLQISLL
jgi:hypothetical protein